MNWNVMAEWFAADEQYSIALTSGDVAAQRRWGIVLDTLYSIQSN